MSLRRTDGPLTRELRRQAAGLGIGQVPSRLAPSATTAMVCGFCSTGCSLDIHLRDGEPVNLTPTASYPVNLGMACPKGWEALTPLAASDRATTPLLRNGRGRLEGVDWPTALDAFVDGFRGVQARHGAESVAFLSTGQIVTEEMALLGALAKFGMGMIHGDGNTRQCMATSVVAYKESFGFDAPPYAYADFEESDVIVLWGANLCIAHPILWERVARNPHRPEIIVVDPRRTETAMAATQHYALAPKSDLTLLYAVAHILLRDGYVDTGFIDAHTEAFDGFTPFLAAFTPERAAGASGLRAADIERLAATIGRGERVSFWWTMGVNQSHEGTRTAQAIINLALMTGNIGRPGTGPNSVTGQCNAMGSRLFSNTTNLLGGRDFADVAQRREVASVLGIDASRIPDRPSWAYDQIIEGIVSGAIRGLWVVATNPAHSWINQAHLHDVLERLDFLVVQDMYTTTETAERADLVLPAAGWGEKDGTFINSERRVGLVKKVARAPGQALADFAIFKLIADAWGCGEMFEGWDEPEDVFRSLGALSRGRFCDFSGIEGYRMIEDAGGIQWPYRDETDSGTERRLFADGVFPRPGGRARFVWDEPRRPAEAVSARYPFVMLTGRGSSAQWHTQTRTAKSPMLRSLSEAEPWVEVSPDDADRLHITTHDEVAIRSARGTMLARALVTPTMNAGQVFVPMHYPAVNRLTHPSFDPRSRQPSYKSCAVDIGHPEPWEREQR